MKTYALCVDIGTSSLKAGIIDIGHDLTDSRVSLSETTGHERLKAFAKVSYDSTNAGCRQNLGAGDWEAAFFKAADLLYEQILVTGTSDGKPDISINEIKAVCISGNGPSFVCCGKNGEILKTLRWYDDVKRLDGVQSFFLPHIINFRETQNALFEKTCSFVSPHEWLLHTLGADLKTCLPHPLYKPFYWDENQLNMLNLDAAKFPPFVSLGSVIACVSRQAAAKCRLLRAGTPLVCGGPDFIMALLGCGVTKHGTACDRAGSSEGINCCISAETKLASGKFIRKLPSAIDGLQNLSVVINESGSLFDEWRAKHCRPDESYETTLLRLLGTCGNCDGSDRTRRPYTAKMLPPVLRKITNGVCEAIAELKGAGAKIEELVVCATTLFAVLKIHLVLQIENAAVLNTVLKGQRHRELSWDARKNQSTAAFCRIQSITV